MCHNVPLWAARGRYPSRPRSPTLLLIRWLGSSRSALSRLAWAHAHETLLWAGKRGSHHTFNYDLINSRSPSASRRRNHRWVMRLALPDGIMPPGQNIRWQEDGGSGDGTFVAVRGLRPAGWSSGSGTTASPEPGQVADDGAAARGGRSASRDELPGRGVRRRRCNAEDGRPRRDRRPRSWRRPRPVGPAAGTSGDRGTGPAGDLPKTGGRGVGRGVGLRPGVRPLPPLAPASAAAGRRGNGTGCTAGRCLVLEDVFFPGHICYPSNAAFDRFVELYQAVAREKEGGDAAIGVRLLGMALEAGLVDVRVGLVVPTFREGEGKWVTRVTMEHIRGAVVGARFRGGPSRQRVGQVRRRRPDADEHSAHIPGMGPKGWCVRPSQVGEYDAIGYGTVLRPRSYAASLRPLHQGVETSRTPA